MERYAERQYLGLMPQEPPRVTLPVVISVAQPSTSILGGSLIAVRASGPHTTHTHSRACRGGRRHSQETAQLVLFPGGIPP